MPSEQATTNLLDGTATTGIGNDGKLAADAAKPTASQVEQPSGAAAPNVSASNATGAKATGAGATSQSAAGDVAAKNVAPKDGSFFDTLFKNKDGTINTRMVGEALKGVGAVAQGVSQSSEANKTRKWQQQMYNARPTGIVRQ